MMECERVQHAPNRLPEFRLDDGFHQVRRNTEFLAACSVGALATRGQHHDGSARERDRA